MSKYDWLLALHVTAAFLVIGAAVAAGVFNLAAMGRERPSEVAGLLRLARVAALVLSVAIVIALALGLWLVHAAKQGYSFGDAWIVIALVLWLLASALGGVGGSRERQTRLLAERLASEGDAPAPELRARLRDPISLALSWGSGLIVLGILALMVWKPGT